MAVTSSETPIQNVHTVLISRLIESDVAMTPDEGDEVRSHIERILDAAHDGNVTVALAFTRLEIVTPAFLNAAVGRLYEKYDWQLLSSVLSVADASERYNELRRRVVKTAKDYYTNTERFSRSVEQVIGADE